VEIGHRATEPLRDRFRSTGGAARELSELRHQQITHRLQALLARGVSLELRECPLVLEERR
jgi:hypothetical protein